MQPVLSCINISKTFRRTLIPVRHLQEELTGIWKRTQWSVTAVDNVSLDLKSGEWVGLYGPNGCGKTTLLRMVAGLLPPDSGGIERRRSLSCFFDLSVGFHEEHTAEENVRMHALLQGIPLKDMNGILEAVRTFAGIGDHWHLPLKCYSVGMRMRLGFSITTAAPGDILLLDEVMAVGDQAFQEQCWMRLLALKMSGRSALMVSHSMSNLERICDRIVLMEEGRIKEQRSFPAPALTATDR